MEPAPDPPAERIVLFVCVGNTFRSVLAEAIFNANPPTGWRAESAGTTPGPQTSPAAIALLRAIGIYSPSPNPRLVTSEAVVRARRVVTFGCLAQCPPGAVAKAVDWPIPGGMGKTDAERDAIRDEIRRRVPELVIALAGGPVA